MRLGLSIGLLMFMGASATSGPSEQLPDLFDLLGYEGTGGSLTGEPFDRVEYTGKIVFNLESQTRYYIEDFDIQFVSAVSSFDLGLGNLVGGIAEEEIAFNAYLDAFPESNFVWLWIVELPPGGEPPFSVSQATTPSVPLKVFLPGDEVQIVFEAVSETALIDGLAGYKITGNVVPLPCAADFNTDFVVDIIDFGVFGSAFGSMTGDLNYNPIADFNGDGVVDIIDFGVFGGEFGNGPTECAP